MNRRLIFVSAFAAVLMISVMVYGQQRGQGGRRGGPAMMGGGMNGAMLLRSEAVQKELGITDEQKTKINELRTAGRQGQGQRPDFQNMTREERQKMAEERTQAAAQQMKQIAEILDEKQLARLNEIRIQAMGTRAYQNDEVAEKLGISAEQQDKMQAAQREVFQAMREAGGDRPDAAAMAQMREKLEAKMNELLTDEQKAKFQELIGKPFDTAQLMQRGGRGGRGN